MKVKDLIAELQKYDQEMLVVVDGYEGDFDSVSKVKTVKVNLNTNVLDNNVISCFGEHSGSDRGVLTSTEVVYLPRKS